MWLVRYLGLFVNQSKESWELKMWWLQGGNNTLTACPRQDNSNSILEMPVLPSPPPSPLPPPPSPPPKKWIAILFNFSQVMQWLQETLKTVLRQFGGGGGGGGLKVGINKACDRRFKSGELCCFPVSFFLLCLVDPTS